MFNIEQTTDIALAILFITLIKANFIEKCFPVFSSLFLLHGLVEKLIFVHNFFAAIKNYEDYFGK